MGPNLWPPRDHAKLETSVCHGGYDKLQDGSSFQYESEGAEFSIPSAGLGWAGLARRAVVTPGFPGLANTRTRIRPLSIPRGLSRLGEDVCAHPNFDLSKPFYQIEVYKDVSYDLNPRLLQPDSLIDSLFLK